MNITKLYTIILCSCGDCEAAGSAVQNPWRTIFPEEEEQATKDLAFERMREHCECGEFARPIGALFGPKFSKEVLNNPQEFESSFTVGGDAADKKRNGKSNPKRKKRTVHLLPMLDEWIGVKSGSKSSAIEDCVRRVYNSSGGRIFTRSMRASENSNQE